jgi:uncharacterized protein YegL
MAKSKKKSSSLAAFILLDRSGSMQGQKWTSAIDAINKYVSELKEGGAVGDVTVVAFDSTTTNAVPTPAAPLGSSFGGVTAINQWPTAVYNTVNRFEILRDAQSVEGFKNLTYAEISPAGGTPLYDSTARIIDLAEKRNAERTVIILMTDGEENTSKEWRIDNIKSRIESCKARNWDVIFLGAEFDVERYTKGYGLSRGDFLNTTSANFSASMSAIAGATLNYSDTGTRAAFTDQLRTTLSDGKTF